MTPSLTFHEGIETGTKTESRILRDYFAGFCVPTESFVGDLVNSSTVEGAETPGTLVKESSRRHRYFHEDEDPYWASYHHRCFVGPHPRQSYRDRTRDPDLFLEPGETRPDPPKVSKGYRNDPNLSFRDGMCPLSPSTSSSEELFPFVVSPFKIYLLESEATSTIWLIELCKTL